MHPAMCINRDGFKFKKGGEGVRVVKVPSKILVVSLLTISFCSEQLHVLKVRLVVELESKV